MGWKQKGHKFDRKNHPVRCFKCRKHIWSTEAAKFGKRKDGTWWHICTSCYAPITRTFATP